jgi:hypothetical protein
MPNAEINWIEFGNQEPERSADRRSQIRKKFKNFLNSSVGIRGSNRPIIF